MGGCWIVDLHLLGEGRCWGVTLGDGVDHDLGRLFINVFMKSNVLETYEGELVKVGLPAVISSGGWTRIRGYGSRIYPVPFLAELFLGSYGG
jgi:hypothetical protein